MLIGFLQLCRPVLQCESEDFAQCLIDIQQQEISLGFMPAMTDDLYPVFVLSCTSARQIVSPNVYIVPVGTHDCWAKPYFEQIIDAFYEKNEFREQFAIKLDEMLLLNNLEISSFFEFSMVISLIVATLILVFRTQLLRLLFGKDEADVMVYKRGKLYSP